VGLLGIINGVPQGLKDADQPAVIYAFIVAFIVYWIMGKMGLRSPLITAKDNFSPISAPGH
jgi:hypothetical protein